MTSVLYLGPPGTFTHMAAERAFPAGAELRAESTIAGIFDGVFARRAELGVVPIENSSEGSVGPTLDGLLSGELGIRRELLLDVEHCLVGRHCDLARVKSVASHPQALAQCRQFLARELSDRELVALGSTAAAAARAAEDDSVLAISSRLAAELFGLTLIREGIQDRSPNVTRFVVIGRGSPPPSGNDRTSIVFSLKHERGALKGALVELDRAGLNLTRIESRPLPGHLWEYLFFVDFEGHAAEPATRSALEALAASAGMLRVLGSYPRAY